MISEPASTEARGEFEHSSAEAKEPDSAPPQLSRPHLGFVLDACPDIRDWAPDGVRHWTDFLAAARIVRPALGVSPSAWQEAVDIMGETDAAIALASILQRHESSSDVVLIQPIDGGSPRATIHGAPAIASAGGYLRALTEQARAGSFSVGALLMAIIGQRLKAKRTSRAPRSGV